MPTRSSQSIALAGAPRRRDSAHMRLHRLGQLPADGIERVERRQRVLENHADAAAPDAPQSVPAVRLSMRSPSSRTSPDSDAARPLQQPDDRGAGQRLAGAGFADDAQDFAGVDAERDTVQCPQHAAPGGKFDDQVDGPPAAWPSAQPRVQRVTQPVAQQVDCQHHQDQRQAGKDRHPPLAGEQKVVAEPDQGAQRWLRRRQADAEKR